METDLNPARLAEYLKTLGNPNRLELLRALRTPKTVNEITLHPETVRGGENPERAISHQAVRDHLAKLRELGVITVERTLRDGNVVDRFGLNHETLFAIVEELGRLGELRAQVPPPPKPTIGGLSAPRADAGNGPRLILVRGQGEGRVFPLEDRGRAPERGWVIGRRRGLAVTLDYDPFVSAENAEVVRGPNGYALLDIRSSRNGTLLNFRPLARGASEPLANGDVLTVGRTHLLFRTS